jgi:hypothetical protein
MRWLKGGRRRLFDLASEEMPHRPASRADDPTAPLVAEAGEKRLPTAETLDLERSIARRARAASGDPDAAATIPPLVRERAARFRRGARTIFLEGLRNLVERRKSVRH